MNALEITGSDAVLSGLVRGECVHGPVLIASADRRKAHTAHIRRVSKCGLRRCVATYAACTGEVGRWNRVGQRRRQLHLCEAL